MMKLSDYPTKVVDEVITEVRAIKRAISERHGNNIERLLASLISQERNTKATNSQKTGTEQTDIDAESDSEGSDKAHPEDEGYSH